MADKKKIRTHYVGDITMNFVSDVIDGRLFSDTKVMLNPDTDTTLCWIEGSKIQNFIDDLNAVINKYRI